MKLRIIFLITFTLLCAACRRGASDPNADNAMDSAYVADSVPTESETEAFIDTARQDTSKALAPEKFEDAYIYVSKPQMKLYVLSRTDSVLFTCGIACGIRRGNKSERGDYRTPEGRFRISGLFDSTDWIHRTKDGRAVKGCYGPHFLRLGGGRYTGIGIHGTNSPRSIGRRASEGCIRVLSKNIVTLYDRYAYYGMPVIVSGEDDPLPEFLRPRPAVSDPELDATADNKETAATPPHNTENASVGAEQRDSAAQHSTHHPEREAVDTLFD